MDTVHVTFTEEHHEVIYDSFRVHRHEDGGQRLLNSDWPQHTTLDLECLMCEGVTIRIEFENALAEYRVTDFGIGALQLERVRGEVSR